MKFGKKWDPFTLPTIELSTIRLSTPKLPTIKLPTGLYYRQGQITDNQITDMHSAQKTYNRIYKICVYLKKKFFLVIFFSVGDLIVDNLILSVN